MNARQFLFLIALLLLTAGCKRGQDSFPRKFEIKLHHLDRSIHLIRPLDLEYLDHWLIWQDHYEGKYYSGYQLRDKRFVRFAKAGKGKDEYSRWPMASVSPFGLGLFNNETKTYQTWNIDSILTNADYFPSNSLPIGDSLSLTFTMMQRQDSSFISTGPNEHGLLAFFGKKGNLLSINGEYPAKKVEVSDKVHAIACLNSTYTFHQRLDRFVIGYLFSGQFEVFQLQGTHAVRKWGVDKFPFLYNVSDGNVRIPISTNYGYVDLDCTDEFIYALFSGRNRSTNFPTYTNTVEVFNWSGDRVAEFELDTRLGNIAVSSDNKYIYGAGVEGQEVGLFVAELPTL